MTEYETLKKLQKKYIETITEETKELILFNAIITDLRNPDSLFKAKFERALNDLSSKQIALTFDEVYKLVNFEIQYVMDIDSKILNKLFKYHQLSLRVKLSYNRIDGKGYFKFTLKLN